MFIVISFLHLLAKTSETWLNPSTAIRNHAEFVTQEIVGKINASNKNLSPMKALITGSAAFDC